MNRFSFKPLCRTLAVSSAVVVGAVFSSAVAQDSSFIPITVNVDATVKAVPKTNENGAETVTLALTANKTDTLRLPFVKMTGVIYFGGQRRANAPIIAANRGGNITVNLPAQSYKNAEISLHSVNGKRVMRKNVSASNAVNSISRRNVATGIYLLSVRGADGKAVTARLTHVGGELSINAAFVGGSVADARKLSKEAAEENMKWEVTVSAVAAGYEDEVFTIQPVAGNNPLPSITLQEESSGGDGSFVEIGGLKWMKKNLNVETDDSWCYRNSPDSCVKYGRLYTWEAAKTACQSVGMRLPTREEWGMSQNLCKLTSGC